MCLRDGYEITQFLRQLPRWTSLRIQAQSPDRHTSSSLRWKLRHLRILVHGARCRSSRRRTSGSLGGAQSGDAPQPDRTRRSSCLSGKQSRPSTLSCELGSSRGWQLPATRKFRWFRQSAVRRRTLFRCILRPSSDRRRRRLSHRDARRFRFYAGSSRWCPSAFLHSIREIKFWYKSRPSNLRNSVLSPQSTLKGWSHLLNRLICSSKTKPSGQSFAFATPPLHT